MIDESRGTKSMKKVLVTLGTRPEIIKMAPVVEVLREDFKVIVCLTAQHRRMADQAMEIFQIKPDIDLNIMRPDQSVVEVATRVIEGVTEIIQSEEPDIVIVQGDTTTTMASALAAFYEKICIGHVEAGLRTNNRFSPFPEELNRQIVSRLATFHFAPTEMAAENLYSEGIRCEDVLVSGNTVVDALEQIKPRIRDFAIPTELRRWLNTIESASESGNQLMLVTIHRRESFGEGFERVCRALREVSKSNPNLQIVFPVHPNPSVQEPTNRLLGNVRNVFLSDPFDYPCLLWLLQRCEIVVTDSGGIQEEAPSFGKRVVILREHTERMEAVTENHSILVGTDEQKIVQTIRSMLDDRRRQQSPAFSQNPFGDGKARFRIRDFLKDRLT